MHKDPLLIVGIGNPGTVYARTRHNIGVRAIESCVAGNAVLSAHKKSGTRYTRANFAGRTVYLAVTTCFMNESGKQIAPLAHYLSITPENLIIVHDELDIPFGSIRTKMGGGEGGHNGLRSISSHLHTKDYGRLRLGIGHPGSAKLVHDYVLGNFSQAEEKQLPEMFIRGMTAIEQLAQYAYPIAQTYINSPANSDPLQK